jgi:TRAP-type C4-dicarboxylate transport system substrate-binding protein
MHRFILILSLVLGLAGSASARKPPRVKLATLAPKGTSYHQILQLMGEKWRQAPGGGVKLTIYTDGTMGSEADMVRRMRIGQLQAAMLTVSGLAEIDDSVEALQHLPMAFRSLDELDYVSARLRPAIEKKFLEKGFVVLFWGDAGWVHFFSRTPATRPSDFKPMKIFVGVGDNQTVDIIKSLGYQPVPLQITDTLTSLQTGLIDAVPSTPFYALAGQFYGPAPYMLEVKWAPLVGGTVILKKTWDKFSPETRAALMEAASAASNQVKARGRAENAEAVDAMVKRGLKVHSLTAEQEAEWIKFAESIYPSLRDKTVQADMFDEVMRLLKEYRNRPAE